MIWNFQLSFELSLLIGNFTNLHELGNLIGSCFLLELSVFILEPYSLVDLELPLKLSLVDWLGLSLVESTTIQSVCIGTFNITWNFWCLMVQVHLCNRDEIAV